MSPDLKFEWQYFMFHTISNTRSIIKQQIVIKFTGVAFVITAYLQQFPLCRELQQILSMLKRSTCNQAAETHSQSIVGNRYFDH